MKKLEKLSEENEKLDEKLKVHMRMSLLPTHVPHITSSTGNGG